MRRWKTKNTDLEHVTRVNLHVLAECIDCRDERVALDHAVLP
jgi:hypothetical protein